MFDTAKTLIKRSVYTIERQLYLNRILSTDQLTLPSFLGLGSAQSGTSWLHENLTRYTDARIALVRRDAAVFGPLAEGCDTLGHGD